MGEGCGTLTSSPFRYYDPRTGTYSGGAGDAAPDPREQEAANRRASEEARRRTLAQLPKELQAQAAADPVLANRFVDAVNTERGRVARMNRQIAPEDPGQLDFDSKEFSGETLGMLTDYVRTRAVAGRTAMPGAPGMPPAYSGYGPQPKAAVSPLPRIILDHPTIAAEVVAAGITDIRTLSEIARAIRGAKLHEQLSTALPQDIQRILASSTANELAGFADFDSLWRRARDGQEKAPGGDIPVDGGDKSLLDQGLDLAKDAVLLPFEVIGEVYDDAQHLANAVQVWGGSLSPMGILDARASGRKSISWEDAWKQTSAGQVIQKNIDDAKKRWSPEAVDVAVELYQASKSDNPAADIARIVSRVSDSGSEPEQDIVRAAFGGYGLDDGRHQAAKDLIELVGSSQGGSFGDQMASSMGLTPGTASYAAASAAGTTFVALVADPFLVAGKMFSGYRAAMWGMERMVGPSADLESLFVKTAGEGVAGATRRRAVTRLWDEVGRDVARYLDAPDVRAKAVARDAFVKRWGSQFGEKTGQVFEDLLVHQAPGASKAGVRDAAGAYSYLQDQNRVLNVMFGRSALNTRTMPRMSATRLAAQRTLAGGKSLKWDHAGALLDDLYGTDATGESVAATQGTSGLTTRLRERGLAPREEDTFRYSQTAARLVGGRFDPEQGKMVDARLGLDELAGWLRDKATDAPRLKYLRVYTLSNAMSSMEKFSRWFSQHPAAVGGIGFSGDEAAQSAEVVYRMARTFTSKGHAALLRQSWMEVTPAQRRSMFEGLIRTQADAMGFALGFADREKRIDELVRAHTNSEQYSPIVLSHRWRPAVAMKERISVQQYLDQNLGKVDAEGKQFVPGQDMTFGDVAYAYGAQINAATERKKKLAEEVLAYGRLQKALTMRLRDASRAAATEDDLKRLAAELAATKAAIKDARDGIKDAAKQVAMLQRLSMNKAKADMRVARGLAYTEARGHLNDQHDAVLEAFDIAEKLIRGEINVLGRTAEQELANMGNAVSRATGGDISDPAMAAAMGAKATGSPAVRQATKDAQKGVRQAEVMARGDARGELAAVKKDINGVLMDQFGLNAQALNELAADMTETQKLAFLEQVDDMRKIAVELRAVDKDIAKMRRRLKREAMPDAEIASIEQEILGLKQAKDTLRAESSRLAWRNMALIEERKVLRSIGDDAAVAIDPSNPFWSPSLLGGKHYALHRYQATDRATMPDFEMMQRYSRRNGLLHSLLGLTWSRPAATAVNLWSLGVLAGPRFAIRNSLEEGMFHLAAGGSMGEAFKGRAIAHEQMEMAGASTGVIRKRGKDIRSGKPGGIAQTEGGLSGKGGSRAAASQDTERLLDEKTGQMLPEVQSRVWWKRAILPYLNADEVKQAHVLFKDGDEERMRQLLHAATMRRMFAGKAMSPMQDSYTRAAYTRYSASVADELADSVRMGMSGQFDGDPKTVLGSGWNFFDEGRMVSDGFVNIPAANKELAANALHDSLTKIFALDGELAQIVARSLHRNATVKQAHEDAIPRLISALNIDAMRKAFADGDLGSLGISKGYIGWTDDMVHAMGMPGEFAERYFASLAHNLSDSTGFLPNQKLLDMLLKDGRYRTMTRTEDGDVVEHATPDNILTLFAGGPAEHPPWVLGETESRQFDHLLAIGDKRLAMSDEFWRHMGMMNARMSRLPIFHANSMNAYAISKPAEDMIAALLRGDMEAQAKAAKVYRQSIEARAEIQADLDDWWGKYTSAIPDNGSIDDMPVVWRGKTISDAVDYVEWVRREIASGSSGWRYSPSRGEVLPDWAKSLTGDAFPISPDVAERIIGQQANDLLARVQPVLSGGRAHPAIGHIDDLLARVGGSAGAPHPLALANEADAAAAFAARGGSSFSLADPTGYRDWRGTHPLNRGNYRLKAVSQLHEDEVVSLRASVGLDADEAAAVWDEARTAAAARVVEWAQEQGMAMTMQMADNPAIRSNAAYSLRNLARFYRATEDFYRRVYRMGRYNPQGIYKLAHAYDLLSDAGGSAKDDQGNEFFVYPGINTVFQQMSNWFGVSVPQQIDLNMTGQYNMLSPSLDASGWVPTLSGPLAAFGYSALKEGSRETGFNGISQFLRDNEGFFLGKMSQGRSLMEQTIPTPLLQLFGPDGVSEAWMVRTPQQRREMQMRIAKDAALADWLQNGTDQPGWMDTEAQAKREAGVYAAARNMMTMRYLFRFLLPASPQVDMPRTDYENLAGVTLNPVFAARVRQLTAEGSVNAFGEATAEFSKLFPQLPLLQESVNEPSQPGARPAATRQSAAWMHDHARLIEEGNVDLALPFLIPAQPGEEYYFPANTEAKRIGAKRSRSYGEYRDSLNAAVGVADWFELSQLISVYRAEIMGQRDQRKLKYFEEEASKLKAQFRSENPDLDEWLRNTSQSGYSTAAFPVSTMKQVESWVLAKVRSNRKPWPHEWAMVEANSAMSGLASAMNETRAESPGTGKLTRQKSAIVGLLADIVSETEPDYQLNVANYIRAVLLPQMNDLEAYSDFKVKLLNLAQEKKGGSGG
jgi:hypothetical protein